LAPKMVPPPTRMPTRSRRPNRPTARAGDRGGTGRLGGFAGAGASLLSSTTRADGFVIVADDSEGFAAGADVDVWLYA